jgi:hypothetical protein
MVEENVVRVISSKRMRWKGHAARIRRRDILVRKLQAKRPL